MANVVPATRPGAVRRPSRSRPQRLGSRRWQWIGSGGAHQRLPTRRRSSERERESNACRCAHYRRFAEQKRAKSAPTARFIDLLRPAARRLPGLPVLLPQPSSAQETPAKSPKSPSCEANFDRRPVRRRVFRRRVLRRRAQKVGKVKWSWRPIRSCNGCQFWRICCL